MQRSTRHGELKGELRQKVEVTRLQLALASSKSKQRQEGIINSPPMRHGECRASTTHHGEHIHSGGELRRSNPSGWRGRNPLGKKAQLAMASTPTREASWVRKKYKRHFIIRSEGRYHIVRCHFRKRENRGKHRENQRSKEHKDWRKTQDQWDIMAWFHSISSFLLVRLPWQWVTKLFLLGLNVVNSISMYSLWLGCCVILIYRMILILFLFSVFWSYGFESWLENTFWI